MLADFALGFGALLLIGAGLWNLGCWFADTFSRWLDKATGLHAIGGHSAWTGNGA